MKLPAAVHVVLFVRKPSSETDKIAIVLSVPARFSKIQTWSPVELFTFEYWRKTLAGKHWRTQSV